ncbi:MAG: DUF4388 domain-containing protein, partial [Nitriliruptor sp.]
RLTVAFEARQGRVDLVDGRVRDASAEADRLQLARRVLGSGVVAGDTLLGVLEGFDELPTDLELARALVTEGAVEAGTLAELVREQTVDADFDLLRWPDGRFQFSIVDDASRGPTVLDLAVPVDELLEETSRRLEAWSALDARTGSLSDVVSVRQPDSADAGRVELPAEGFALLTLIDGRRTLGDLVALSGRGEHRTRRSLDVLVEAGVVEVGAADAPSRLEQLLHDHDALSAREHQLAATGQRDEAPSAEAQVADAPAAPRPGRKAMARAVVGPDEDLVEVATRATNARSLRTKVRTERLRTDPSVDEDLVSRLIEGVQAL